MRQRSVSFHIISNVFALKYYIYTKAYIQRCYHDIKLSFDGLQSSNSCASTATERHRYLPHRYVIFIDIVIMIFIDTFLGSVLIFIKTLLHLRFMLFEKYHSSSIMSYLYLNNRNIVFFFIVYQVLSYHKKNMMSTIYSRYTYLFLNYVKNIPMTKQK